MKLALIFFAGIGVAFGASAVMQPEPAKANNDVLLAKLNKIESRIGNTERSLKKQDAALKALQMEKLDTEQTLAELKDKTEKVLARPMGGISKGGTVSAGTLDEVEGGEEKIEKAVEKVLEKKKKKDREETSKRMNKFKDDLISGIAKDLELDDYTTGELQKIADDTWKKIRDLWMDQDKDWEEKRKEMQKIRDDGDAKVKNLLTEDQYTKYKKAVDDRSRWGGRGGRRGRR